MFIHFLCLCPLRLAIMLNFNISKVAYSFTPYSRHPLNDDRDFHVHIYSLKMFPQQNGIQ